LAINQIYSCAGTFRDDAIRISGVKHNPPDHKEVIGLVREMCSYVNENWDKTAIHLASYLMWRINWIHPFFGGNGRTARAVAYLVLCARLGFALPGRKTIPDLLVANRDPYYQALRQADEAWEGGSLDVSMMESLMSALLAQQLADVHRQATGKSDPAAMIN
jgi:Fic family protein